MYAHLFFGDGFLRFPMPTNQNNIVVMLQQSGQEAASKAQLLHDQTIASLLASVRVFMPNRSREGPFRSSDHMPSIATAIHIRRRFNPIASELLKNDSLSDMSDRRILFEEFLAWLAVISGHENLGSIMGQVSIRFSHLVSSLFDLYNAFFLVTADHARSFNSIHHTT